MVEAEGQVFRRLKQTTDIIAKHPDYPGKDKAVECCLRDIEDRWRSGMLTGDQKDALIAILGRGQRKG